MKLITPILGGFAALMAIFSVGSYFIFANQDNRGTSVGFFVGTAVLFAVLAYISTYFNKSSGSSNKLQQDINVKVRRVSLLIVVPVILFIAALYILNWLFTRKT